MALEIVYKPLKGLIPFAKNSRSHPASQVAKLKGSLVEFGWARPLAIADGVVVYGHGVLQAALELAEAGVAIPRNADPAMGPTVDLSPLSASQRRAYVIADNRMALDSGWSDELLKDELSDLRIEGFDLTLTGFDMPELAALFADPEADDGLDIKPSGAGSLVERFGIAPFTVLNAREGWWQDRKRAWIALGIQSEVGRGEGATPGGGPMPLDREKDRKRAANATPGGV